MLRHAQIAHAQLLGTWAIHVVLMLSCQALVGNPRSVHAQLSAQMDMGLNFLRDKTWFAN